MGQSIMTGEKKKTAHFTDTRRHQERKEEYIMTSTAHPHPLPKISPLSNSTLSMGASFQTHKPVRNISKAQRHAWMVMLHLK